MASIMHIMVNAPPKTMQPGIVNLPNGDKNIAFVVKDSEHAIRKIGSAPEVTMRSAVYKAEMAALGVFLFNIEGALYQCYLNYYDSLHRVAIDLLCEQEDIILEFRDMRLKRTKQLMVSNGLINFARSYRDVSSEMRPWEPGIIEILKCQLYEKHGGLEELWSVLHD